MRAALGYNAIIRMWYVINKLKKDPFFISAFVVFIIGSYLRFTNLYSHAVFLGDQGRDALIIADIAKLKHFTAIGASTSIGGVFLGPFYYYFIAPWLLIFRFDPVGLAYGVAFFSSIFILLLYFAVADLLDKKTAIVAAILIAFSSTLIEFSRFSWNPNLLPLFSFFTIYFLIKSVQSGIVKHSYVYFFLSGAFFSFSTQLHYLAVGLFLPIFIYLTFVLIKSKQKIGKLIGYFIFSFAFFIFSSPLLIFDLRHGFINTKSLLNLLKGDEVGSSPFASALVTAFQKLNLFALNINLSQSTAILFLIILILIFVIQIKKRSDKGVLFLFFFGLLLTSVPFSLRLIPHYLSSIYPIYFILLAWIFSTILFSKWGKAITIFFLISYIFVSAKEYRFLKTSGDMQIYRAKVVAEKIRPQIKNVKSFTLTAIPFPDRDNPVRYFLTQWGYEPLKRGERIKTDYLVVLCEQKCKPIGDPQWDIAFFEPKKIIKKQKVENMFIYFLTR